MFQHKLHMQNTRPNSCGFTLTELAIVLTIIGVVLAGVWVAMGQVQNASRVNQAAQDMLQIAANVRSTYAGATSFNSGTNADITCTMVDAGVIPADLLATGVACVAGTDSTYPHDAWGGLVRVYANMNYNGETAGRYFRVSFYNISPGVCARIASQVANIGTADGPTLLTVNANGNSFLAIPETGNTMGLTTQQIDTECNLNPQNPTGNAGSVEFDFTIH